MSLAVLARKTRTKQKLRKRGKFILNMTGRGNVLGMNAKMSRGNCKGLTTCAGKRAACCVGVGGSQCCEFPHGGQPAPQQSYRVYLNRKSKGAYRPAGGKQCKDLSGCTSAKSVWKQGSNLDAGEITRKRRDNTLACYTDIYTAKKDTCTGCPNTAKIEDNTITQAGSTQQLGTVKFQPITGGGGPVGADFAVGNPDGGLFPNVGTSTLNSFAENGYIQQDPANVPTLSNFRLYFLDDITIADAGFYFTPSWDNTGTWANPFFQSPVIFTSITFTDNATGGTGDTLTYFYKDSIGFKEDPIAFGLTGAIQDPCTTRFFEKGFINGSEATIAQQTAFFANTASAPGGTTGGRNLNISVLEATRISNSITKNPDFNNDVYPNINIGTLDPAGEKMFPEPSKARILIEPGVFPEFTIFGGRDNYPIPGFYAIQFRARGNSVASQGQTVTLLYKDAVKYTENGVGPMLAWTPGSGPGGFDNPLSYLNGESIGISGESITTASLESFFTGAAAGNVEINVIGPFFNTWSPPPAPCCCPVKKNICGCRATDLVRYTRINKSFGCQTTKAVRMGRTASEQIARRRAAVDCIKPKHRTIYFDILNNDGLLKVNGCCGNQCLIQGQQYTFVFNQVTPLSPFTGDVIIQWCQGVEEKITIPADKSSFSFTVPKFNKNCQPATEAVIKTPTTSIRLSYCKKAFKTPQMLGSCSGR